MAKFKEGDLLTCLVCGLVVVVDESCGCAMGEIICCMDKPMVKGKAAAEKSKKKATPAVGSKPTATSKAVKPAAPKAIKGKIAAPAKAVKPVAKAKVAVKKTTAKKPAAKAKK